MKILLQKSSYQINLDGRKGEVTSYGESRILKKKACQFCYPFLAILYYQDSDTKDKFQHFSSEKSSSNKKVLV